MPREFTAEVRAFREASLLDLLTELCATGMSRGCETRSAYCPPTYPHTGFREPEERMRAAMAKRLGDAKGARGGDDSTWESAISDRGRNSGPRYFRLRSVLVPVRDRGGGLHAGLRDGGEGGRAATQPRASALGAGVSVPEGREEELRTGLRVEEELGATHVAAWSFAATESMSKIRPARPEVVWAIIGEEFRRLRTSGAV